MFLAILLTSFSKRVANRLSATWKVDTPDQNKSKKRKEYDRKHRYMSTYGKAKSEYADE